MNWLIDAIASELFRSVMLLVAAVIATASVVSAHRTAKKKQAIEMILQTRQDDLLSKSLRKIQELHHAAEDNIRRYGSVDLNTHDTTVCIRYALNHYEFVAIGIDAGIYDEQMIKNASYSTITKMYERAAPFIEHVRTAHSTPTYFQALEALVKRWKEKPLV
ncbi:MAG TPA: DUF4760 domain-containing protein [Solimonas sp.]